MPLGPEFRQQWATYAFCFCCEQCAYFDPHQQRCAHGWPEKEHRTAFYRDPNCTELVFCKEFELA